MAVALLLPLHQQSEKDRWHFRHLEVTGPWSSSLGVLDFWGDDFLLLFPDRPVSLLRMDIVTWKDDRVWGRIDAF